MPKIEKMPRDMFDRERIERSKKYLPKLSPIEESAKKEKEVFKKTIK